MGITTYAKFDGIQEELKRLLNQASDSVRICVAWLNIDIYGPILTRLIQRDVDVHLIVNNDDNNDINKLERMKGLNFRPLRMRVQSKLMHNKFCIIDERTVITGSYNWSANAESHFENIVVVKNDYRLVKQFLHEYHDLRDYHMYWTQLPKCHCKSNLFRLAILGYESGRYSESMTRLWNVCVKHNHVSPVHSRDEQFLYARLGMADAEEDQDSDTEYPYANVCDMRSAFENERETDRRIGAYFERYHGQVHCIGYVVCINANEFYKGYDAFPEYKVDIPWRNSFFRKIIPRELAEYSGEVDQIIDVHKPVV